MIKDLLKRDEMFPLIANLDPEKVYSVDIHELRKKRSLNANSYAWVLITKLADVMRVSKDETYELMLQRYGQSEIVSVVSEADVNGYFKHFIEVGKGRVNGREFTHYRVMKGSSEYDTREMSIFIDGVVSECQDLGIETMTPDELANLKSLWKSVPSQ